MGGGVQKHNQHQQEQQEPNNNQDDFEVFHNGLRYNITDFVYKHPGGTNYLRPFQGKEITKNMIDHYHTNSAFYMMREYKVGGRETKDDMNSEDLEKLVDWSKPMVAQIRNLGPRYMEWVNAPVDRPLILFGSKYVEMLTMTPWYMVPLVWIPVIAYLLYHESGNFSNSHLGGWPSFIPVIASVLLGIVLWTLIEYMLHRYVFHLSVPENSKFIIYIHFLLHGLHHKVPFDHYRLVFPPFPAAILGYTIYTLVIEVLFPSSMKLLVLSGGLTGYLIYDMIHFYLHYGNPKDGSYIYKMKRYHNHHHFTDPQNGFGISSMEWDRVFRTTLHLRELKKAINWDKL